MVMRRGKEPTSYDQNKYYIDMNEMAFKSVHRLMFLFKHVAKNELNMKTSEINRIVDELAKETSAEKLARKMNKHIGKHVVFYWGPGDDYEITKLQKKQKPKRGRPKKSDSNKSDSMSALDKNLKQRAGK